MKFTQLKSTLTAENLNDRVAQMFGSKIKLESFTAEQLTAARDKLANQLQVIENQANFDAIHSSEAYQKNRLFLKVIEQRIAELSQTDEKAKSPYAIGMAQAMKSTGDTPPLKKSTIKKAHDIAKSVEKNESETAVDENMSRQHFQYVADTLKDIQDPIKRAEYAKHHSAIFQHFNPRFDHAKFMAAAGVNMAEDEHSEADLEKKLDNLKQKYNAQMANAYAGDPDETEQEIAKIEKQLGITHEGKKMKKDKMNESVVIATDSPEEASMMMQLLKLAGVQPVSQDMINAKQEPEAKADETYANEPNEKVQSVDDLVNTNSGGINRQKIQANPNNPADNPLAMGRLGKMSAPTVNIGEGEITEEQLSNSLRAQYESFKQTYQEAAKAKPDYLDFDKDGNKAEPMTKALKDKEQAKK